jgi:GTP-binding protein HflX
METSSDAIAQNGAERAVLVAAGEVRLLEELGRLASTLEVEVVGRLEQARRDPRGYLGKGKREELCELVREVGAGIVITDDELTASQARVLERDAGTTVVDRTEVIIRIFELHARDRASRLEVELADLSYRLPRVKGRNEALSRLGGGGATTRGPGEQQLEYDRRIIRNRMRTIERRLAEEKSGREVRGARLQESLIPTVALVGYTNAGKTTILNALSGESRSTADRLFETLATTTRLVHGSKTTTVADKRDGVNDGVAPEVAEGGGSEPDFVLTDTVGFIRKLPTQLVHSFASTLESATSADVVVLCADAGSEESDEEIRTVRETMGEPEDVLCLNKADVLDEAAIRRLEVRYPDAVIMSALEDASPLLDSIQRVLARGRVRVRLQIPHSDYGVSAALYGHTEIHERRDTEAGVELDVTMPKELLTRYSRFRVA